MYQSKLSPSFNDKPDWLDSMDAYIISCDMIAGVRLPSSDPSADEDLV